MIWIDRMTEKPRTFTVQNNSDGTITLIPAFGLVLQEGVPINAANLNKTEKEISDHAALNATSSQRGHVKVDNDSIVSDESGTISGTKVITGTYADTSTSIPASSTYTITIPLGINAKSGTLIIRGIVDYIGMLIHFTTNNLDTMCLVAYDSDLGNKGTFACYSRSLDGEVLPAVFSYAIRAIINDAYINGSNLTISLNNTSTLPVVLGIKKILWEVSN